jgi:hypothetical protein
MDDVFAIVVLESVNDTQEGGCTPSTFNPSGVTDESSNHKDKHQ